jgi:lipopolysaccharide/colanic/teichoic acid biosynthesis glycosyltransferase
MSLVGPRPLPTAYLPRYSAEQARRHEVRPGVTGLAQVSGRNALTWEQKLRLDVEYVDNHTVRGDLVILVRTVASVISARGVAAPGSATMPAFVGSSDAEGAS